ncbi:MAG TPA: hypothetical protein VNR65_05760 [Geobacterales bacterium]|nr:hypothetical protein [Geobacterales bacterium]
MPTPPEVADTLCYGLEGSTPIVPSAVSTASAIQKLISGVLIFLFGLALRNMLKVK